MNSFKSGKYGKYNDKLYRLVYKQKDKIITLCSNDKEDLNNGFICEDTADFIKKYGFVCTKEVSKNEIEGAYDISSRAIYKGQHCAIWGGNGKEKYLRCCRPNDQNKEEFEERMKRIGFEIMEYEQYGTPLYGSDSISNDDPDLEIIEEVTPIEL